MITHVESIEFADIVAFPEQLTIAWRQMAVETAVQWAIELQAQGRHLLLSGDAVAPGELLAAPSATRLEALAICHLDVQSEQQRERLVHRGDPEEILVHHLAFAEWMRGHAYDPRFRPEVITTDAWEGMHWNRWLRWHASDPRWQFTSIDTTELEPSEVSHLLLQWCWNAINRNDVPFLTGQWASKGDSSASNN